MWLKYPDIQNLNVFSEVTFARHILLCPWVSDYFLVQYFFKSSQIFKKWSPEDRKALRIYMHLRTSFREVMDTVASQIDSEAVRFFTLVTFDMEPDDYLDIMTAIVRHGTENVVLEQDRFSGNVISFSEISQRIFENNLSPVYNGITDVHDLHVPLASKTLESHIFNRLTDINALPMTLGLTNTENIIVLRDFAAKTKSFMGLNYLYRKELANMLDDDHDNRILVIMHTFEPSPELDEFFAERRRHGRVFKDPFLDSLYYRNMTETVIKPSILDEPFHDNIQLDSDLKCMDSRFRMRVIANLIKATTSRKPH